MEKTKININCCKDIAECCCKRNGCIKNELNVEIEKAKLDFKATCIRTIAFLFLLLLCAFLVAVKLIAYENCSTLFLVIYPVSMFLFVFIIIMVNLD